MGTEHWAGRTQNRIKILKFPPGMSKLVYSFAYADLISASKIAREYEGCIFGSSPLSTSLVQPGASCFSPFALQQSQHLEKGLKIFFH